MKLKKVLSIVLAFMLVMSCMSFTAFAGSGVSAVVILNSDGTPDDEHYFDITGEHPVQDAIDAAESGQTVQLKFDLTENVTFPADKILTLDLNGHVLKGTGSGSVITAIGTRSGTSQLTITDSNQTAAHYFAYQKEAQWTLIENPTEEQKTAAIIADAIDDNTPDDTVIRIPGGCVTGGTGSYYSDELDCCGGAVYAEDFNITLSSGNIIGNYAGYGGGIFVYRSISALYRNITMNGGAIIGNKANSAGGGIYSYEVAPTIAGGTISRNTASNGGGISIYNTTLTATGGRITYNTAVSSGGGISTNISSISIGGVIIAGNKTNSGSGGGIYCASNRTECITISSGSIRGNEAYSGGGIGVGGTMMNLTMTGGEITDNVATYNGGGINIKYGSVTLTGGAITGNKASYSGGVDTLQTETTVGGSVQIIGNTTLDGTAADNFGIADLRDLTSQYPQLGLETELFTIDRESLDAAATKMKIGVKLLKYGIDWDTEEPVITGAASGTFTAEGCTCTQADEAYFFSDDPAYADKYNEAGGLELVAGYTVTEGACEHGSVSVGNQKSAYDGEQVTIDAVPDAGYKVDSLTATYEDSNGTQNLTITDGKFIMPAYAVTVNATFAEIQTSKEAGDNFDLDLETSTENIHESTTVDQYYIKTTGESTVYNHRIGVSWSSEVMNIKVADAKKWNPATLSWKVDGDKNGEATVDGDTNKKTITLTNCSAKAFTCSLTFEADDSVAGKYTSYSVDGTDVNLAAVTNDITKPGQQLHTGDLPSATITATITPTLTGEGSFHGAAATTENTKYGTFTITCNVADN